MMLSANFRHLAAHDELLVKLASLAERYVEDDPNSALIKLRQFSEALSKRVAAMVGFYVPGESFVELLNRLSSKAVLPEEVAAALHSLRRAGNAAAHEHGGSVKDARHKLKLAYAIGVWFHQSYGNDPGFKPPAYREPARAADERDVTEQLERLQSELEAARRAAESATATAQEQAALRIQAEALAREHVAQVAVLQLTVQEAEARLKDDERHEATELEGLQAAAAAAPAPAIKEQIERGRAFGHHLRLDEADTRRLIDEQLRQAGWYADSEALTYKQGARPVKGKNLAIAEWSTASGPADYVLFAGLVPLAVVEAKRKAKDVYGALEQARRYSRDYVVRADETLPRPPQSEPDFAGWSAGSGSDAKPYRIPFLFATNGRPYLRQLETESGIWSLDARRPTNLPKALTGWPTPKGLLGRLDADEDAAAAKLAAEPTDYLGLRGYQLRAIRAVETAIADGARTCLVAMATGTGKTKTVIGLLYRLLKAKRFKRVLFLVDRESLGEQAQNAFKEMRLEADKLFAEIYEVKGLGDIEPEEYTKVHVATVQSMVQRLFNREDVSVPVDRYDCIIVDESHRGYNLDREMGEGEMAFRSLYDYVSTYRRVLDHFDAVKIGLTATPALHTREIFGDPVFTYSYREAVADDWLVDHEAPVRLVTKLAQSGIHFDKGDKVTVLKPVGESELAQLPDELDFEVDHFNRTVIAPQFTKVVCRELARHLDPQADEKTLVFCVNDRHADQVVAELRHAFAEQYGEVDNEAVIKITGASDKPMELIRRFKNERHPNVVVTVDLLTTGIDVPKICNLVFLRRVRSRILYEQMLGRATRLCPEIRKAVFRIYDAVDLYDALEPVTAMKPLVKDPTIPLGRLVAELTSDEAAAVTTSDGRSHATDVLDQLVARLRRRARRLSGRQDLSPTWLEAADHLETLTGCSLETLPQRLHALGPAGAATLFRDKPELLPVLETLCRPQGEGPGVYLAEHEDELVAVERGYGPGRQRPEDYLSAFGEYVRTHLNEIPALVVVTQRPRELTRQQLRELRLALDTAGFREVDLRCAWRDKTNQDIAASIIGYIRQQALGSPLVPYEERVDRALKKILGSQPWTNPQRNWLERIAAQFKKEVIVDRPALDEGAFKSHGGFRHIDKALGGNLTQVLEAFGDAIWADEGTGASVSA